MSDPFDVVVIGSGPAGTHASYPLVKAGLRVAMIDGGNESAEPPGSLPALDYEEMRRTNPEQHRWFLGDDFSGIPLDPMGEGMRGSIVSGRRSYVIDKTEALLPVKLDGVHLFQSLALGGLGAVWGGVCAYYAEPELVAMGLPPDEMQRHYDCITERIGVSGPPTRASIQPPFKLDHHSELLLKAQARRKRALDALKVGLVQPHSAVLTQDLGTRRAATYRDMDYWVDPNQTVYRPKFTLDELKRYANFSYFGGRLVEHVEERVHDCAVHSRPAFHAGQAGPRTLVGRNVVVAAGAVGSARILLRSFGLYDRDVPILAKPHWLTACLHLRTLGRAGDRERLSLCQLLLVDQKREQPADYLSSGYAQIYSYKSLGLNRMLNFVPFSGPEALSLLALLVPSFIIADLRFPVVRRPSHFLRLCRDAERGDYVHIHATHEDDDYVRSADSLRRLNRALRVLGLLALKQKPLPHGSTAHYAGTIPQAEAGSGEVLSVDADGKLQQGKHIYVADSATFKFLPAKSINMTIMANANRIGERVRDALVGAT